MRPCEARRIEDGLCINCGVPRNNAFQKCERCLEQCRTASHRWRNKRSPAAKNKALPADVLNTLHAACNHYHEGHSIAETATRYRVSEPMLCQALRNTPRPTNHFHFH